MEIDNILLDFVSISAKKETINYEVIFLTL